MPVYFCIVQINGYANHSCFTLRTSEYMIENFKQAYTCLLRTPACVKPSYISVNPIP